MKNGNSEKDRFQEAQEVLNKSEKEDDEDPMDKILSHVGGMGRYQMILFFCMLPFGLIFTFVYFGQMFITPTPQRHWCRVPELSGLSVELRRNLSIPGAIDGDSWDRCSMYNANWSQVLGSMKTPPLDTPRISCVNGWEFELGDIPYHTIVSERGWVCEYSGNAPLAQAMFFGGALIGGVIFGWLADTFGRVPAIMGSNLVGFVGSIGTIYTSGLWDFIICRFLVGMAYDSCFMIMYILVLEYVGTKYRTWAGNMSIALFFGGGCILLPWLAVWIADWRRLVLYTSLPMLLVLALPYVVPESARWLMSRGRVNQAVENVKKFEKVNGKKIPQDVLDNFIISARQTRETKETIGALFANPSLRIMMVYMVIVFMACALVFDGLVRLSESLGTDFFITFTLTSATEIPSITLLAFVLDKWGRRWLTCGPMTLAGLLAMIGAFVPLGIPQVSLAILSRFFINMSYNAAIQWDTELLPTGVRASGNSLVHVSGYIATVLSPFVVYSERYWHPAPLLILGALAVLASVFGFLLPETNGKPMPQTIADGEMMFKRHRTCGGPVEDEEEMYSKNITSNLQATFDENGTKH